MTEETIESFIKFEKELIKLCKENWKKDDAYIAKIRATYKQFIDKAQKSEFKEKIKWWFDNNCEVIEERKRVGTEALNIWTIRELFISMQESLKFESDHEFFKFLDNEFDAIMY